MSYMHMTSVGEGRGAKEKRECGNICATRQQNAPTLGIKHANGANVQHACWTGLSSGWQMHWQKFPAFIDAVSVSHHVSSFSVEIHFQGILSR